MTERDLKILKQTPVPAPEASAKAAAIAAALAAFDGIDEKHSSSTQGNEASARPTHMTSITPRRRMMRLQSSHYAIAASVAAAFVVVPVALHYMEDIGGGLGGAMRRSDADRAAKPVPLPNLVAKDKNNGASSTGELAAKEEFARKAREQVSQGGVQPGGTIASPSPVTQPNSHFGFGTPEPKMDVARQRSFDAPSGLLGRLSSPQRSDGLSVNAPLADHVIAPQIDEGRDQFQHVSQNSVKQVSTDPVSTFSVDVDTASYGFVRRSLNAGRLPPSDSVRVEEMVNYFNYDYAKPASAVVPFEPTITVMPAAWNRDHQLVHIAIKGYELASAERPRANLVFLIDVSGSMQSADRLPLLKSAFKMLLDNLKPDDTVGIVTYASGSGVTLQPTKVSDKAKIAAAIDALGAGGSTAGAAGIEDAYRLAEAGFDKEAVNRVILATDGDFNVGVSDRDQLQGLIERKRLSGVYLSIIGVGQGNYNDALMQKLAQNGNGAAAYIDTLNEARKVLVEEASSTLFPIAKDVKIQVEFNPAKVSEYRLIGYETRALRREDFNNDKVDAGDVGSGHAVTAIYEITPVGARKMVDPLRFGETKATEGRSASQSVTARAGELGFLKLRYKLPNENESRLLEKPIEANAILPSVDAASPDVRFATAVAAFGQLLRGGTWLGAYNYDDVIALASKAKGDDPFGLRAEFVNLVRLAKSAQK